MTRNSISTIVLAAAVVAALLLQSCCCCTCKPGKTTDTPFPGGNKVEASGKALENVVWPPGGDGSTNSTMTATGLFNGAEEVCIYDLSLHYDRKLTIVEVYAAPSSVPAANFPGPDDTYLVVRDTNDTPTGSGDWVRDDLPGTYDGSSSYKMMIRAYYLNPAFGVDVHTANFTNISSGTWESGLP